MEPAVQIGGCKRDQTIFIFRFGLTNSSSLQECAATFFETILGTESYLLAVKDMAGFKIYLLSHPAHFKQQNIAQRVFAYVLGCRSPILFLLDGLF